MKVLQLIDSLAPGGAERMCVNIANLLADNGVPIVVCATRKGGAMGKKLLPGIPYYVLHKKSVFDLSAFTKLIKIIRDEKITHIHAHSTSIYWGIAISFFFKNTKLIWHDHYGQSESLHLKSRKSLRLLSKQIDYAIPVNKILLEWMKVATLIPAANIRQLPNFSLLEVGQSNAVSPPVILCLANFRTQKNHVNLISALSLLKSDIPNFRVILAGQPGDKSYMFSITAYIQDTGLSSQVSMLYSVFDPEELLSQASIGVLSSDSEGLPLALLEYGLAGLPVVCTRVGQCAEVLEEGRCGMLVPPNDPDALASALRHLLTHREAARKMGERLKVRVSESYSGAAFLKGYLPLLNEQA